MEATEKYLFRFVPTMRCNFKCTYCFLGDTTRRAKGTMFDNHSVNEWIDAMKQFSDKEIEIYMWGGEPFILDDTYTLLNAWLQMNHIANGCRIDTNLYFADKIAEKCPSGKLKLNCSYHMKYHSLDEEFRKIKKLKDLDMVGMLNFVASEENMMKLKQDYNMTVHDLIAKFADINVFVNIAADFAFANNPNYEKHDEYKKFIFQFIPPEEWNLLRGDTSPRKCDASKHFFTVNYDGAFTTCGDNKKHGNFFEGIINPSRTSNKCSQCCQSLISYPWKLNNTLTPWNSLLEYVKRCENYRKTVKTKTNFDF